MDQVNPVVRPVILEITMTTLLKRVVKNVDLDSSPMRHQARFAMIVQLVLLSIPLEKLRVRSVTKVSTWLPLDKLCVCNVKLVLTVTSKGSMAVSNVQKEQPSVHPMHKRVATVPLVAMLPVRGLLTAKIVLLVHSRNTVANLPVNHALPERSNQIKADRLVWIASLVNLWHPKGN